MLSKGELPVVPDTQETWRGLHSFPVNDDVGLPGVFSTSPAEEGRPTLGYFDGQSRLSRPSDHFIC